MDVQPYQVHIPEDTLDDLRQRLARTRWPDEIPGSAWDYGSNLDYVKDLVEWAERSYNVQRWTEMPRGRPLRRSGGA